ncbi:hypothetical protein [Acidimangrovimonas sediminis]|uniref:hypothetical protein n=1 Tax=Acidimangrovimonas sediminis TaxID=2056283 RepID=UPI000C7FD51C|nr:hypothetical protein [Acidimangrovimonas sediminis]
MTSHSDSRHLGRDARPVPPDLMDRLLALAERIRVDPASGRLVIANGAARIVLCEDGTIRIEGRRIVEAAEEDIALSAAWIDLN